MRAVVRPDHCLGRERQRDERRATRRRRGERRVPTGTAAEGEGQHHDARQRQHFCPGHEVLHPAPRRDPGEIDCREKGRQPRPDPARVARVEAREPAGVLSGHDRDPRDRGGIDRQSLDPAHHEAGARAERLAHVHVLPAGGGVARRELGEAERAQQRQRPARDPGDEGEPWAAQPRSYETGRAEDPRPDHDPDDHGEPVQQPQRSFEVRHGGGMCIEKNRGAACCAPTERLIDLSTGAGDRPRPRPHHLRRRDCRRLHHRRHHD